MPRSLLCILSLASSLLLGLVPLSAQTVPSGMTYQGRLTDASNAPVPDGTGYEIEVRLWSAPTGGTLLWGTRYTGVPLKSGAFNIILGSGGIPIAGATHTLLAAAFNSPTVHLGVTTTKNAAGAAVPNPTEILPRQQIFSTPYAFRAETAVTATSAASVQNDGILSGAIKDGEVKTADVADGAITASKLAAGAVTPAGIAQTGIPFSLINQDFAYFIDEKPQGTSGGGIPSNSIRRTLNRTVYSSGSSITRNGDLITLSEGIYWIDARVPGYNLRHSGSLVNANTGAVLLAGRHSESAQAAVSEVRGILQITDPSVELEIKDTLLATPAGSSSLGKEAGLNAPEKYTEISITRIK